MRTELRSVWLRPAPGQPDPRPRCRQCGCGEGLQGGMWVGADIAGADQRDTDFTRCLMIQPVPFPRFCVDDIGYFVDPRPTS
jgi:hypothetical protein